MVAPNVSMTAYKPAESRLDSALDDRDSTELLQNVGRGSLVAEDHEAAAASVGEALDRFLDGGYGPVERAARPRRFCGGPMTCATQGLPSD